MVDRLLHQHDGNRPSIDTGAPIPVAVEYVEPQLTELWREVAEAAQAKGGTAAVTMAQVLNLIVRADSYEAANQYTTEIDAITGTHPARMVMMITDPAEEQLPLQAWVSIHCQLPPAGGKQVCSEQISVAAGGNAVRQIPAAVIPVLLPEMPVFLWWPKGSPFDDYLFRHLADSTNRLIVDSATFENPEGALAKMATRLRTEWPQVACTDMNWARLTRWREMVAQFFDGAALRPYLDLISRVTVDYALSGKGGPVNRAQALLVAGWLASRLGWQPVDPVYELLRSEGNRPASARLSLQSANRPITVLLRPSDEMSDMPGDIQGIKLEVFKGDNEATGGEAIFEVAVAKEEVACAWIGVQVEGASATRRNIQLEDQSRALLLDNELEMYSKDRVYDEALEMVSIFIRGVPRREGDADSRRLPTGEPVSSSGQRPRTNPPQPRQKAE